MSDFIWFCQCDTIAPGGHCMKHGDVNEEDRLRRKESAAALERLKRMAEKLGGWHLVEKLMSK